MEETKKPSKLEEILGRGFCLAAGTGLALGGCYYASLCKAYLSDPNPAFSFKSIGYTGLAIAAMAILGGIFIDYVALKGE